MVVVAGGKVSRLIIEIPGRKAWHFQQQTYYYYDYYYYSLLHSRYLEHKHLYYSPDSARSMSSLVPIQGYCSGNEFYSILP